MFMPHLHVYEDKLPEVVYGKIVNNVQYDKFCAAFYCLDTLFKSLVEMDG